MNFARANRTNPDNVFITGKSVEGATITAGLPVAYQNGVSMDGVNVVIANAAADFPSFIGVAFQDIPNNDFGLVQVGGFVSSILLSNVGSSITINSGDPLVPSAAGLFSGAPTYANSGFKFIQASNVPVAVSAAAYASGLIKLI